MQKIKSYSHLQTTLNSQPHSKYFKRTRNYTPSSCIHSPLASGSSETSCQIVISSNPIYDIESRAREPCGNIARENILV